MSTPDTRTIMALADLMPGNGMCDKCGKPVAMGNDAVTLELTAGGNPMLLVASPRHLLPTDDCEGSPSRAQYIEGQPRDTRYRGYDEELEPVMRAAYVKMNAVVERLWGPEA